MPWRVASVETLPRYRLRVCFLDGLEGIVDMSALIASPNAGVFAALADLQVFNSAFVRLGAVCWPGDLDIAPDAIHAAIEASEPTRVRLVVARAEGRKPERRGAAGAREDPMILARPSFALRFPLARRSDLWSMLTCREK